MATETGPLRLHAPTATMYDTSAGETAILRGLTPETIGMMMPFLRSQEINQQNRQDEYGGLIQSINRQQGGIAASKLANDRRKADQDAIGMLVQHAGLSGGAALNGLGIPGLPAYMSTPQAQQDVANTSMDRRLLDQSKAFLQTNQGLEAGTNAGVNIDPGQVAQPGAAGRLGLRATTGEPLALRREALEGLNRARTAGASDGQLTGVYDPLSNTTRYSAKGSVSQVEAALDQARQMEGSRTPGTSTHRGAGPAAASDRPRPSTQQGNPAPTSGATSPASGRNASVSQTVRADLEQRIGTIKNYFRDSSGRLLAIGTRGTAPVPER